jgi:prefoldin subunit 5
MVTRTYVNTGDQIEQTIVVHVDEAGYIRMTADHLDHLLTHIGFQEIQAKRKAA